MWVDHEAAMNNEAQELPGTYSKHPWLLLAPSAFLYAFTFAIPLVVLIASSFEKTTGGVTTSSLSIDNYQSFFVDGVAIRAVLRTLYLSFAIATCCLLLGYPVAMTMRRAGGQMRLLLLFFVVSPLLTSVIVRNVAWILVLGREGLINVAWRGLGLTTEPLKLMYNDLGVVIGVVHVYLAFVVLPVFASLIAIDPAVEESAASLGASRARVFWHVTLPLSMPGVIAGFTLVFVLCTGLYLTPVVMGGNFVVTISMIIADLVRTQFDMGRASAFAVMVLLIIAGLLWLSRQFARPYGAGT
jgi:putative spermidine/putrescine transport system permease protein